DDRASIAGAAAFREAPYEYSRNLVSILGHIGGSLFGSRHDHRPTGAQLASAREARSGDPSVSVPPGNCPVKSAHLETPAIAARLLGPQTFLVPTAGNGRRVCPYGLRWTPLSRPKPDDSSPLSHQGLVIPPSRRPRRRGSRRG